MCNNIMHEKHIKSPFIQNRGNKKETLFIFLLHSHTHRKHLIFLPPKRPQLPNPTKHTQKRRKIASIFPYNIYFCPPYPTCCLQHRPHHTKSCRNNNTIKIWYYKINVWEMLPIWVTHIHTHTVYTHVILLL